ncbi:MAG: NAD(P)-dependent oxidoreductase, partial [Mesorhizobium sp.]
MKRVLVTGGCGFIGRHVAQELADHGYRVRLLDALVDQVHGAEANNLPTGAELIKG